MKEKDLLDENILERLSDAETPLGRLCRSSEVLPRDAGSSVNSSMSKSVDSEDKVDFAHVDGVATSEVVDPATVSSLDGENTTSSSRSVDLAVEDSNVVGLPNEISRNSDGALECAVDASSMGVPAVPVPESPHLPRWKRANALFFQIRVLWFHRT